MLPDKELQFILAPLDHLSHTRHLLTQTPAVSTANQQTSKSANQPATRTETAVVKEELAGDALNRMPETRSKKFWLSAPEKAVPELHPVSPPVTRSARNEPQECQKSVLTG